MTRETQCVRAHHSAGKKTNISEYDELSLSASATEQSFSVLDAFVSIINIVSFLI